MNNVLRRIYKNFLDKNRVFGEFFIAEKNWVINEDAKFDELDIDLADYEIEEIYKKYGVIQLRKYSNQDTLIIGCGNRPLYTCGGEYLNNIEKLNNIKDKEQRELLKNYREDHSHNGCCTINPDMGYNPTVIAHYGYQKLPFPDKSFSRIIFEGFCLESEDRDYAIYAITDLIRLLKSGGEVITDNGDNYIVKLIKKDNVLFSGDEKIVFTKKSSTKEFLDFMWGN